MCEIFLLKNHLSFTPLLLFVILPQPIIQHQILNSLTPITCFCYHLITINIIILFQNFIIKLNINFKIK